MSNFYFFYMIVLTAVIYVGVRTIHLYRTDIKKIASVVGKIAVSSVIGVLLVGVLFLPVFYVFLNDARIGFEHPLHLFYPLSYYSALAGVFLSSTEAYWLCGGFAAPALLAVFVLFLNKKKANAEDKLLKILCAVGFVLILFPFFGQAFNGFAHRSNRWCWSLALLVSYILVSKWEDMLAVGMETMKRLLAGVIALFVLCLFCEYSRSAQAFSGIGFLFVTLTLLYQFKAQISRKRMEQMLCLTVICSVISISFWKNASGTSDYASKATTSKMYRESFFANETMAVKEMAEKDMAENRYVRYSGRTAAYANAGMLSKLSSTSYYWSIPNSYVTSFRSDLSISEEQSFNYVGYDDCAKLLSLAAVDYFVVRASDSQPIPYGFEEGLTTNIYSDRTDAYINQLKKELGTDELTDEQESKIAGSSDKRFVTFKNKYALPLGYCYDSYVTEDVWSKLSATERQELMMKTVYLSGGGYPACEEYTKEATDNTIPYTFSCGSPEITYEDSRIVTTAANTTLRLEFSGRPNAETYLVISGLGFDGVSEYELYFGDDSVDPNRLYNKTNWDMLGSTDQISIRKEKIFWTDPTAPNFIVQDSSGRGQKSFVYSTADDPGATGRHDFLINMGYSEEPITSITITFPNRGVYTIDSLKVVYSAMDDYEEDINNLRRNTLQNIQLDTDSLTGSISLDKPQILCIAVPYSPGWKAYVDGTESEIYLANGRYMGIELKEGEHVVELNYSRPYQRVGMISSAIGILFMIVYVVIWERKNKSKAMAST